MNEKKILYKKNKDKITLKDIAEIAGVTSMTVSRVVSGKGLVKESTRNKILKIVRELDYKPNLLARSLSSMRSMTIGIIIPKTEQVFLDNYLAQVLSGVMTVVKEHDYKLMIYPVEEIEGAENLYLTVAHSKLVDGIILLKPKIDDKNLKSLAKSGFPYILINHRTNGDDLNFIDTNIYNSTINVVKYLYEKGCHDIGFVAGNLDEQNCLDQLEGFKAGLKQMGLPFNPEQVVYAKSNAGKAYTDIETWINNKKKPDAIFCANDYMAIAVMDRLKSEGIAVPDEIAVVGFNDIDLARFTRPTLTTVKQPLLRIGKKAAESLIDLIEENKNVPVQVFIDLQLMIRESA
ncbi:MAG: LacI family DNA-binding transcriptional regulator [Fidelibacterota bacterium]